MEKRYEAVAAAIRTLIKQGRWKPGEALPTEESLASAHGVSRTTVRSALGLLRAEGYLDTHPSKGSVVRHRLTARRRYAPDHPRGGPVVNHQGIPLEGAQMVTYRVEVIRADPEVAAWLEVAASSEVTVRRRLWSLDGEPLMCWDSYFPRHLVKGTSIDGPPEAVPEGTYLALDELGMRPTIFTESVAGRKPSDAERTMLRIADYVCVFEVRRRTRNRYGLTIEGLMIVCAQDRNILTYEDIEIPEGVDLT